MGVSVDSLFSRRRILFMVLCAALLASALAILWGRAIYGSMQAYERGRAHLEAGRPMTAIVFFDRSIRWYAPFNAYVDRSAQMLWQMALEAQQQGDTALALVAIRTIRQGFHAARGLYTPGADWINRCDEKLDELLDKGLGPSEGREAPARLRPPDGRNRTAQDPHVFWTIVVEAGFLGWVGSAFGFILFACRGRRKWTVEPAAALLWGGLTITCFVLWIVGMMRA